MIDLHLTPNLSRADVRSLLARIFEVDDPVVIEDLEEDLPSSTSVWCLATTAPGDFRTSLQIYVTASDVRCPSEEQLAREVARDLDCECLTCGDDPDPYRWVLTDRLGRRSEVDVEVDAFRRDELVIADR